MDHLAEMFHGIVVDGSSSCIPGDAHGHQQEVCDEQHGEDESWERFLNSSTPSSGHKRCSSTTDTASSPPKKPKATMSKMFEGLITEMQTARNDDIEVFNQIKNYQLEKDSSDMDDFSICLSLAEESGDDKDSDEYYMGTKLFKDKFNRATFHHFDTPEQRMKWLQRHVKEYFG
jgi:hypothetical protein